MSRALPPDAPQRMLRIGCVKYLNARPLVRGWPGEVEFDHPSVLCQRLAKGELDVALVSSFEFLRNPIYQIVDGVSVSSDGPVYSVVVAYNRDISEIQEIALDPASQTSVNLLRCLLGELGLKPGILSGGIGNRDCQPLASSSLHARYSARLLIGDQAILFREKYAGEIQFWDLGEQWKNLTGLPFVYALWLIRPEISNPKSISRRLRELRDQNLANLGDLIADYDAFTEPLAKAANPDERKMTRQFVARYFTEYLRFSFGEKEKQGLEMFARLCAKHGLLPNREPVFRLV